MSSATLTISAPHEQIVITPRVRGYSVRRYYDPQTGQFISVDPLVDQTEAPYGYAGQDPINNYDLDGTVLEGATDGSDRNPICETTGCGVQPGGFPNVHTSLLRIAVVGVVSVGVVATGVLADDFVAAALADAAEEGAAFRQTVRNLFSHEGEVRRDAIRHLKIRLNHSAAAAVHELHRSGGSAYAAARAFVQVLWRGHL